MDRKEDVEQIRKQLTEALEKSGGTGSEDLKNMLEALKVMEEQPEIREAWTPEDERLFQSRGKPRVAHTPNHQKLNKAHNAPILETAESSKDESKVVINEPVEWKGIKEKNFVGKKPMN